MYKRTKGQCKKKTSACTSNSDTVDRLLVLMQDNTVPMSLVASPKTRVLELKSIFEAEYPLLQFSAYDASSRPCAPCTAPRV